MEGLSDRITWKRVNNLPISAGWPLTGKHGKVGELDSGKGKVGLSYNNRLAAAREMKNWTKCFQILFSFHGLLYCFPATSVIELTITAEVMVYCGWPVVICVKELTTIERLYWWNVASRSGTSQGIWFGIESGHPVGGRGAFSCLVSWNGCIVKNVRAMGRHAKFWGRTLVSETNWTRESPVCDHVDMK